MEGLFAVINSWLASRAIAKNTSRLYRLELERFFAWLRASGREFPAVTSADVEAYLAVLQKEPSNTGTGFHMRRRKALTYRSIEQTRRTLLAFFNWAVKTERLQRNPVWTIDVPRPSRPSRPRAGIERTLHVTLQKMLTLDVELVDDEEELRLATIVHLAFWAGASSSELAFLLAKDFRSAGRNGYLSLPLRHTDELTEIQLPTETRDIVMRYLELRRERGRMKSLADKPLVASLRSDAPLSGWSICNEVRKWRYRSSQNGVKTYGGLRGLRRSFIKLAVESGAQELLLSRHLRCQRVGLPSVVLPEQRPAKLYAAIANRLKAAH